MSDRWFIIKDGQALGPFTPEEIRQSLREGTFDPFDLVTREGSSLRRELVEVDELFYTTKVIYAGDQPSQAGAADAPVAVQHGAFAPSGNLPAVREGTLASGQSAPEVGGGMLALASAGRATLASQAPYKSSPAPQQNTPRKRRKDPKRFHVMDPRGRVLGPISASEIQALFYKGVLDKDVKVMRDGSKAQVPVARFVAIYSETNRAKRAMQQGAHPMMQGGISRAQSMPMPRVAMGTPSSSVSPIAVIAVVFALVFGGIAVYVFLKGADSWSAREKPVPSNMEKQRGKRRVVKPLPDQVTPQAQPKRPQKAPTARLTPAQAKKAERMAELKRQRAKLLELKQRREARNKGKNKFVKPVSTQKPVVAPQPKPLPAPKPLPVPTPKPAAKPAPAPAPAPVPAPAPAPKPKSGVAALQDGQQVEKLGPMNFDKGALAACDGSCNLTFTGAGGSVKAAFFKQVWGPTLEGKGGGVYLSGLVKKNGDSVKIILSNVQ